MRHRAQMKHTLGHRSAASAVAFLKADSQAGGGGVARDCHGWSGIPGII